MAQPGSSRNLANSDNELDIRVWTEQAILALRDTRISDYAATHHKSSTVALDIPLDDVTPSRRSLNEVGVSPYRKADEALASALPKCHEPYRRDSLNRRDALLQGKPGSRRRQKWENDRLLGNPWVQPPLPSDWEVHPTYPVHTVPYFLASLWDDKKAEQQRINVKHSTHREETGRVPKELRNKLKHSKGAKGLLQDLEEEVRRFLLAWEQREKELERQGLADVDSSEDDEIVFVGRNGDMNDLSSSLKKESELKRNKLIIDSVIDDQGASFGRWLVHSIAHYYNLISWSITIEGSPVRRQAYVGMNPGASIQTQLPRPLWVLV